MRTTTKVHRIGKCLVAYSGDAAQGREMLAWAKRGFPLDDFPPSQRDKEDWAPLLVVNQKGEIHLYENTPYPVRYEDAQYALGSGRDFALAAMHLGKSAAEAVEIASVFDPGCGNGVDILELK